MIACISHNDFVTDILLAFIVGVLAASLVLLWASS